MIGELMRTDIGQSDDDIERDFSDIATNQGKPSSTHN